jgi:hypothetical protein
MHHRILIKALGDTIEEALAIVKDKLEETVRCSTCDGSLHGINWDYVGDITLMTEDKLKEYRERGTNNLWDYDSLEECAKGFIARREGKFNNLKESALTYIRSKLEIHYRSLEEAPLKQFTERAREILKKPSLVNEFTPPKKPSDMAEVVLGVLVDNERVDSTIQYYLERIDKLNCVLRWGDQDNNQYSLHCADNHYADITEHCAGKDTYYFWCDRHY